MSTNTTVQTETKHALKTPSLWKIVMHNDDFTPMDFVVEVLVHIFHKPQDEALTLMMRIHQTGRATIGLYTKEVALAKTGHVGRLAEAHGHPLLVTTEEA